MITIYKYPIEVGKNEIEIPGYRRILSTGLDMHGNKCIWAIVNTDSPAIILKVEVFGTGWDLTKECVMNGKYIGRIEDSPFYNWHVFEIGVKPL